LEKSSWQSSCCAGAAALCAALLCAAAGANAQPGGMPGAYLRSPVDAAAAAMGGAQSASPTCFSTWWNPAQLSLVDKRLFAFGAGLYSMGRTEAFSSLEFKLPPRVGIGLGALYRGDPFIDNLYNASEEKLDAGSFTTLTVKAGLSYLITRRLSAGLSIGFFYQRLPTSYVRTKLIYSDATAVGGFTLAAQYKVTDSLMLAVIVRDVNPLQMLTGSPASIAMEWQVSPSLEQDYGSADAGGFGSPSVITDMVMPVFVLASAFHGQLQGKPLEWTCDLNGYIVDGTFTKLDHMEAQLSSGFEWQRWNTFCLRAGLGDILISRDITSDWGFYARNFTFKLAAGFGWELSKVRKGLTLNYAVSTDKVWAGIDQKLDIVYKF
jgi:hypothetical protein